MPDPFYLRPSIIQGPIYALGGTAPRIARSAWIAPTAAIIGDVEIGEDSSIWFGCVLRGDTNRIAIGARTNIQDLTMIHVNPGPDMACIIGDDVTVGHSAIVHAARLHDRAFVGMASVVLDQAEIEPGGVLAAGAVLTGRKRIGPNELWGGTPARLVRVLSDEERGFFSMNAPAYAENARYFRAHLGRSGDDQGPRLIERPTRHSVAARANADNGNKVQTRFVKFDHIFLTSRGSRRQHPAAYATLPFKKVIPVKSIHAAGRHALLLGAAATAAAIAALCSPTASAAPPTVNAVIDEHQTVELVGNTRPEATLANDRGMVADGMVLDHMQLLLKRPAETEAALAAHVDALHDPASPEFHHWMSAAELGVKYGPAASDVAAVAAWLTGHGFAVGSIRQAAW